MHPNHVTAFEYQTLTVGDDGRSELSTAEAGLLTLIGQERRGFCTLGHRSLRLTQYVGLVNLGGRVLEVLPKIGSTSDAGACRGTLLRLLRLAHDLPLFSRNEVGHDLRQQDLLDVFVAAYLDNLALLVRAGLLRRYRTEEEDIGVVRGRLLLKRQLTVHAMRIDRIACSFDELNVDNAWNQVLKAALVAVRPWIKGVESGRRWIEMNAAFDEVSHCRDGLALLASITLDRQAQHYAPALHWAGWILRLLSPNLRAGANQAPELLFDMNRLFETAVATVWRRRAGRIGWHVDAQDTGRHLTTTDSPHPRPFHRLRPDLVVRDAARVVGVADTKWSRVDIDSIGALVPPDAHVYQLHAYASVYPCEELALIYPWHEGLREAHAIAFLLPAIRERQPRLHVVCIDVGNDEFLAHPVTAESELARLFV